MTGYGQFCPMAKAMEVLDERWTLLVVRELLLGSTHFNELRRGVPRMSPALLSKRLRSLEHAGILRRVTDGRHTSYHLTEAGRELDEIVSALNRWGVRWIGSLGQADLDPHLLLWDVRRTIDTERWPRRRTVVELDLTEVPSSVRHWWLVVNGDDVDVCDSDPGYDVDARVALSLRSFTEIWRGDRSWGGAVEAGLVRIDGAEPARRRVTTWIGQASIADVPRPGAAGVVPIA